MSAASIAQPHQSKVAQSANEEHSETGWLKAMCVTGVDYFSSLGYQPSIAFAAAGVVSPIATILLVLLTIFGALPVYRRVSQRSFNGQGSISMLESLLSGWWGKILVLVLIGFAATDFVITITLSAADAGAHLVQNPLNHWAHNQMFMTLFLLAALGALFLKGFKEVIGVAVALVAAYLTLNTIVMAVGIYHVCADPHLVGNWWSALLMTKGSMSNVILAAALVFPALALGLSGFETGVAVMPMIKGGKTDTPTNPIGRIANTGKLLRTSALIMAAGLISSSFVTTLLIPAKEFAHGGPADGRAIAYLAHKFLGDGFGTIYDFSTVGILWFAGASALAGLINLVPRYLPRYGMAPEWARATRPLVAFFIGVSVLVTIIFHADVDAQGGAYATGVLVLIASAAFAVTLSVKGKKLLQTVFGAVTLIFIYTLISNVRERPDGLKVASCFIVLILIISAISRAKRSLELRHENLHLSAAAKKVIESKLGNGRDRLKIIAHRPNRSGYIEKLAEMRERHGINRGGAVFLEVEVKDPSEFFENELDIDARAGDNDVLVCRTHSVAPAIAKLLLGLQAQYGCRAHCYFAWSERGPLENAFRYVVFGEGEIGAETEAIVRREERNPEKRPFIHIS